ncbi:MAG: chemotaxis protein CheW [Thiohalophilus sp.]|uniref:chemotaxis protein CheW n=1 Tax=Thiohalophilus sp. TaxID=3028392 RepID=UPI0028700B5A|nr:chemotaxis protein CheW [Thiohalophilus sp.]MDR9436644.1 chemotaxis protein CheW [Thiohalophilus sp.]
MSNKPAKQTLVEEKVALDMFLQSLLREPASEPEPAPAPTVTEAPPEAPPQVKLDMPAPTVVESAPVVEAPAPAVETRPETPPPAAGEDLPPWADLFQAMLFRVAGLTLAVPLEELGGVIEFDPDQLTEMPGHADFYLGLVTHLGKSVPVVDTARLVFPPEKLQQLAGDDPLKRARRVVLIDEGRWGLACDEVDEVITLRRDEVRWRSDRTRRRWLLGTVIQHMCALVDTGAFATKLTEGRD